MDSNKLNDWMQVFGIFALVGSLIFVGLQMRQTQEIAIASQHQSRAEAQMDFFLTALEADYLPVRVLRDRVTANVPGRDVSTILWLWHSWDNYHYQYQAGFLEESAWQGILRNIRSFHAQCDRKFVFEWRRAGLRAEFVELIDSLDDKCVE